MSGTDVRYTTLSPDAIARTAQRLRDRVSERFPGSGLLGVATALAELARESRARVEELGRANIALSLLRLLVITALLVFGVVLLAEVLDATGELLPELDSYLAVVVYLGATGLFVWSLERRWRRRRALAAISELRALVHVVDMHQLLKDPSRAGDESFDTPSSPERDLAPFELSRYLDYCSEMLSLVGKLAALYAQSSDDDVVLDAADGVESLSASISSKIWQKLVVLRGPGPGPDAAQA